MTACAVVSRAVTDVVMGYPAIAEDEAVTEYIVGISAEWLDPKSSHGKNSP
jgi:hypothetical protein